MAVLLAPGHWPHGWTPILKKVNNDVQGLLAIKNGWTLHYAEAEWNINCLAIADQWILAVEMRFPAATGGLDHGAGICASVARQAITPTGPRSP